MSSLRTLRFAVGTALFALGGCQKDKAATKTPEPEASETTNVGPTGEPAEKTNVGPEPESTNVGPQGEPQPTANPAPTKSPE